MTSRRNNPYSRPRSHSRRWWFGLIIFVLILLIFGGPLLNQLFGGPFIALAKPAWLIRDFIADHTSNFTANFKNKQLLASETARLRQELAVAQALVLDQKVLREDNIALRVELGLRSHDDMFVVGKVISNPLTSPYDVLLVDLGSKNSVWPLMVGDLVTFHNVIALGRVIQVSGTVAKISLFSTGTTELPVVVGPGRIPALATGRGAGNFVIQLPRTLAINVDDSVLVTLSEKEYLLGKVGAINKGGSETLQNVLVRSPLNTNDLVYVEIHDR